jgi:subtilisin-like proprotein convertase family protein
MLILINLCCVDTLFLIFDFKNYFESENMIKSVVFTMFFATFTLFVQGQNCKVPFSITFAEKTTNSIKLNWSDSNINPEGWEIELIKKGEIRKGIPTTGIIIQKEFILTGLSPSTAYELYIRTKCSGESISNWNVAISFTTVLEIPTLCKVNIPLKDNGTEILSVDVPEKGILGKDIFIERIDMIIDHTWPADLKITLESPQGQQVVLSNNNGTVTANFGDVQDLLCNKVTSFAPGACLYLKNSKPPYIGTFLPDGNFEQWKPDTLSKGYWKVIFFDRAVKDVGILRYFNIKFNKEKCLLPQNFSIKESNNSSVTVKWETPLNCSTIKLLVKSEGTIINTYFADCSKQEFKIDNLLPDREYEITLTGICSFTSQSQESCKIIGSTTCEKVSISESFDKSSLCSEGCSKDCTTESPQWYNAKDDSTQDWIVWKGNTDTPNTGPSGDINQTGKYIYVENNPAICGVNNPVILQSSCINIQSNFSSCDMSFYYHMHGSDITWLKLEVSINGGQSWHELFYNAGDQGDQWKRETISLAPYTGRTGMFRFSTVSSDGILGDIALDQIEFYKSERVQKLNDFYSDADNDGYGTSAGKISICSSVPPAGYSVLGGDCDDNDPKIHPGALEIHCNGIDENCNGMGDDQLSDNPIKFKSVILPPSCNGSVDGKITLEISGGSQPYSINWNNGTTGNQNVSIRSGVYYATITDAEMCILFTDFIELNSGASLNIVSPSSIPPSCNGKSDGKIFIEHTLDNPPYVYLWSDGSSSKNLINVPEGNYAVTVTDAGQCSAVLDKLKLTSKPSMITDIKSIRHPPCAGQMSGQIELITINGLPPYSYKWSNGSTDVMIRNLKAGIYFCTVTDQSGCSEVLTYTIQDPLPIKGNVVSTEDVRCFGEQNGSIKTDITGGKPPYTFLWNNFDLNDDIFNLKAGVYTLTVTDGNGCNFTMSPLTIRQPEPLDVTADSIRPASCTLGKNGFISLKVTGGNGGYNYAWKHTTISKPSFSDLISGNYTVTVYDKLGCKGNIPNIFIPYINIPIGLSLDVIRDIRCYDDKDGVIATKIKNGKPPFDYNWNQGIQYFKSGFSDTLLFLASGQYKLTITDSNGCTGVSEQIQLKSFEPYTYKITEIKNNICNTDTDGMISIDVSGGSPPYGILWNEGKYAGNKIANLPTGTYKGIIVDANGCVLHTLQAEITAMSDIKVNGTVKDDRDNSGIGEICVNPSGGLPPYSIIWSLTSSSDYCISQLTGGLYRVTITDNLGCAVSTVYIVNNLSATAENDIPLFIITPNPAFEYLTITGKTVIDRVNIMNIQGKSVTSLSEVRQNEIKIDINTLERGIYLLELFSGSECKRLKFLKF